MDIGDFNDFLNTLTPDVLEQITNDANLKLGRIRGDTDPFDFSFFGMQVGVVSLAVSLELLGLYHKWLGEQL